jgi:hypothetical protein
MRKGRPLCPRTAGAGRRRARAPALMNQPNVGEMMDMMKRLILVPAVAILAACGGGDEEATAEGVDTEGAAAGTTTGTTTGTTDPYATQGATGTTTTTGTMTDSMGMGATGTTTGTTTGTMTDSMGMGATGTGTTP